MADQLTACLGTDAATVIAILTAAPFNHTYIQTFGNFTNGNLVFNVYKSGGVPSGVGGLADNGDKVIIHTQSP